MPALKLIAVIMAVVVFASINDWPVLDKLVAALLTLLVVAYIWSRLSLRSVGVVRETSTDRAQVGHVLTESLEIQNHGRFAKLWLEIQDYSTLPGHQASRVVHCRGRHTVRWQVETPLVRRGRFRLGPMIMRSGDPFGLFPARLQIPGFHELIVYPPTVDLSGFPLPTGQLTGGTVFERRNPFVTPSVAGLREYAPGDSLNRISWTATARTGRMMVKEFELDPTADIWLVLDLQEDVRVEVADDRLPDDSASPLHWLDATEEYAITIAASAARRCLDEGRNVGLIASGAYPIALPADRSDRQLVRVLETLAVAEADGARPLAEILVAESHRFTKQSSLVLITSSTDESWVGSLIDITGRRVRACVIIVEPETFGPAPSALLVVSNLVAAGVPAHLVKYGDDIGLALNGAAGVMRTGHLRHG